MLTEEEKQEKIQHYKEVAKGLLGHRLCAFNAYYQGTRPQVMLVYWDYKPRLVTQAELQELMPEVEFVMVKREFSPAARLSVFEDIMLKSEYKIEKEGQEPMPLLLFADTMLGRRDLSEKELRYNDTELDDGVAAVDEWIDCSI